MDTEVDEYAVIAHQLVDDAINKALTQLNDIDFCDVSLDGLAVDPNKIRRTPELRPMEYDSTEGEFPNVLWPTIDEFSEELGVEKIHEFIKTWQYDNSWMYCIDLIAAEDMPYNIRYRYRVRWSVPTRRQPIPRATASVYFTMDVSKIKPRDYTVSVYYVFEGNRLVHRPGTSRFDEKWIKDIIENKVLVIGQIDF